MYLGVVLELGLKAQSMTKSLGNVPRGHISCSLLMSHVFFLSQVFNVLIVRALRVPVVAFAQRALPRNRTPRFPLVSAMFTVAYGSRRFVSHLISPL